MVKNLPASIEDKGSIPGLGTKIPHAAGQLSPCITLLKPTHPRACALPREATSVRSLCTLARESLHAAMKSS